MAMSKRTLAVLLMAMALAQPFVALARELITSRITVIILQYITPSILTLKNEKKCQFHRLQEVPVLQYTLDGLDATGSVAFTA
jgi:hypothetical protein